MISLIEKFYNLLNIKIEVEITEKHFYLFLKKLLTIDVYNSKLYLNQMFTHVNWGEDNNGINYSKSTYN